MTDIWVAIILGIVEGLTEFLPVSSTGHLILATELLGYDAGRWAIHHLQDGVVYPLAFMAVLYRVRLLQMNWGLEGDMREGAERLCQALHDAVTASGVHVLAYLGNGKWIEADPTASTVIEVRVPERSNAWFNMPVKIVRWQVFANTRETS